MAEEAQVIQKHQVVVPDYVMTFPKQDIRFVQKEDADVPLTIESIQINNAPTGKAIMTVKETLDSRGHYLLFVGKDKTLSIAPGFYSTLLAVILSAALINNFVFTKYLGLCVFFGTSKRRDTAIGMGVTFTIVALLSGLLAWFIDYFVLVPLKLSFLQIIVFIGVVAFLVQASDTILRKIQPTLHRKFGIYIVLITTNCIILAVPLLNATAQSGFWESIAHSLGAGLGFALALFLMSCSREKVDLAPVPLIFKGLPIAFIIAGLFALSFLGFSGLKLM